MLNLNKTKISLTKIISFCDKYKIVLIIGLFLLLLAIQDCRFRVKENQLVAQNKVKIDQSFQVIKEKGETIIKQKQLLVTKDNQIVKQEEKIAQLKNLKAKISYQTVYVREEVFIPYKDTVQTIVTVDTITNDTSTYVKVPQEFEKADSFLTIKGSVQKDGVLLDSIAIENQTTLYIGDESKHFFKVDPIVKMKHSNPYINQTSMSNIIVDPEISKKAKKNFVAGFVIGGVTIAIPTLILIGILAK